MVKTKNSSLLKNMLISHVLPELISGVVKAGVHEHVLFYLWKTEDPPWMVWKMFFPSFKGELCTNPPKKNPFLSPEIRFQSAG